MPGFNPTASFDTGPPPPPAGGVANDAVAPPSTPAPVAVAVAVPYDQHSNPIPGPAATTPLVALAPTTPPPTPPSASTSASAHVFTPMPATAAVSLVPVPVGYLYLLPSLVPPAAQAAGQHATVSLMHRAESPWYYLPPPNMPEATTLPAPASGLGTLLLPGAPVRIHVIRTPTPPWLVRGTGTDSTTTLPTPIAHQALVAGENMTVRDLLAALGAHPADRAVLCEVFEEGGGRWARGQTVFGAAPADLARTCKELGWDARRIGERDAVWLWVGVE